VLSRVVDEDLLGGVPVRDFRWFKGRRFYSGWYWSATTGGLVAYESRLELARILLADFDPEVTAIAAQPFLLTGFDGETGFAGLNLPGRDPGVAVRPGVQSQVHDDPQTPTSRRIDVGCIEDRRRPPGRLPDLTTLGHRRTEGERGSRQIRPLTGLESGRVLRGQVFSASGCLLPRRRG